MWGRGKRGTRREEQEPTDYNMFEEIIRRYTVSVARRSESGRE